MENFDICFFGNDITDIITFAAFLLVFAVQIYFYSFFYRKPLKYVNENKSETTNNEFPGVSVVIVAKDDSENLKQSLPLILEQKYPNFEVIVVNIGFTEETEVLIKGLKLKYSNLYDTFLPNEPLEKSNRKKLALTIGIKASKNEILLFTEPSGLPKSGRWIESMIKNMTPDKDVVIGYCNYQKSNKFFNRIARFDHLLYSLQYLSSAIKQKSYFGTIFNIAYRKELFFNNKGYSSSLNFENSEGLFINQLMKKDNVGFAIENESFVETSMNSFNKWERLRIYYYKIKKNFRNHKFAANRFCLESISRYLFYILLITLIYNSIIHNNWIVTGIVSLLFIIKITTQLIIINKAAKYFEAGVFRLSFIIVELLQPLYNLLFKLSSKKKGTTKL